MRLLFSCVLAALCSASALPAALAQAAGQAAQGATAAQIAPKCTISGRITAGTSGLPGVAITVTAEGISSPLTSSSQLDGTYSVGIPGPGRYQLRGELGTFTPVAREVVVDSGCRARVDITMTVGSRPAAAKPATPTPAAPAGSKPATGSAQAKAPASARPGSMPGLAGLFQRVTPRVDAAGAGQAAGSAEDAATIASHLSLPNPMLLGDPTTSDQWGLDDTWGISKFTHQDHTEKYKISCHLCHHTYGKDNAALTENVDRCVKCHKAEGDEKNPLNAAGDELFVKNAFHIGETGCIECHKREAEKNPNSKAAATCAGCHEKKG